ncbi:MAG: sel1 repeat family protein [Rhodoferax sp.]|nr:sel1 repeat family protein [Rhodoferax sp.]
MKHSVMKITISLLAALWTIPIAALAQTTCTAPIGGVPNACLVGGIYKITDAATGSIRLVQDVAAGPLKGLADGKGNLLIAAQWSDITPISDKAVVVADKNNSWLLLDIDSGKITPLPAQGLRLKATANPMHMLIQTVPTGAGLQTFDVLDADGQTRLHLSNIDEGLVGNVGDYIIVNRKTVSGWEGLFIDAAGRLAMTSLPIRSFVSAHVNLIVAVSAKAPEFDPRVTDLLLPLAANGGPSNQPLDILGAYPIFQEPPASGKGKEIYGWVVERRLAKDTEHLLVVNTTFTGAFKKLEQAVPIRSVAWSTTGQNAVDQVPVVQLADGQWAGFKGDALDVMRYASADKAAKSLVPPGKPSGYENDQQRYQRILSDLKSGKNVAADEISWATKYEAKLNKVSSDVVPVLGTIPALAGRMTSDQAKTLSLAQLQTAASANEPAAQGRLGVLYLTGQEGAPTDPVRGMALLRLAAEAGEPNAMSNMYVAYHQGLGVARNEAQALEWLKRAANAGNAKAQGILAGDYLVGDRLPKDLSAAVKWWRLAADGGDAYSQEQMGENLWWGDKPGIPTDHAQAVVWYRKAAAQGKTRAQFMLGLALTGADGVAYNYPEGRSWLEKAATAGDKDAPKLLSTIDKAIRDGEARRVQSLSGQSPTPGKPSWMSLADDMISTVNRQQRENCQAYASGRNVSCNAR